MDCHNRPAHSFKTPERAIDIYLDVGRIDTTLPYIKREALNALVTPYPDVETAEARIGLHLSRFYKTNYPEVWETRKASVNQAIDKVRAIYRLNFFPDMKVDWKTYPNNIGHKNYPGCFRCHDGSHVDQNGVKISHECHTCHTFLNPVTAETNGGYIQEGEFIHPVELQGLHKQTQCYKCHTGGAAPARTCEGCHKKQHGLLAATLPELKQFDIEASPMYEIADCESCHDLSGPVSLEAVDKRCLDCHSDEQAAFEGLLATWAEETAQAQRQAETEMKKLEKWLEEHPGTEAARPAQTWLLSSRQILRLLADTGPLHNYQAAINVYERLARDARRLTNPQQPGSGPKD